MPVSRKRGGKKQHNKRIKNRNKLRLSQFQAIEALKRKIWEEAKARYEEEQKNPKENEYKININGK